VLGAISPIAGSVILNTIWPQGLAIGEVIEGRTIRRNMLKVVLVSALAAAKSAVPASRADRAAAGA
jgi:hypothetical protein